MARHYDKTDGLIAIEKSDDRLWILADAIKAAAAAQAGDTVEMDGQTFRVIGVGREYKHRDFGRVCRLYVAAANEVPMTGGATERQVVALMNFGVWERVARSCDRAQASEWIDMLLNARSMPDSQAAIADVLRKINI